MTERDKEAKRWLEEQKRREQRTMKEKEAETEAVQMKQNKPKVVKVDTNTFVYSGITVKKGNKYYIISKSPFNNEVLGFACDSKGEPKSLKELARGSSFAQVIQQIEQNDKL